MEKEKNKWIEGIFDSFEGSKRAQPDSDLFAKIQAQLPTQGAHIIPMKHLRAIAGVAAVLILLNVFALNNALQNRGAEMQESNQSIISDYNLYEG